MSTKNTTILISGASIAGANHPTWLGLARELGIGLMTRTGEDHFALFGLEMKHVIDGEEIKPDKGKILEEDMKKIFIEIGNDAKQIKKPAVPWSESDPFIRKHLQEFDDMSVDDRLGQLKTKLKLNNPTLAFREMEMLLGNNLVTPLKEINYLGLLCLVKAGQFGDDKEDPHLLGFWQQTEAFRCTDGCQALVKKMFAKLTDANAKQKYNFKLLTTTPVRKITIDPTKLRPVTLTWDPSPASKKLNPSPMFDYVILATPPSVWNRITITPKHPKDTFAPQMGPAVKFFSNLKDRFWIREGAAPSGISSAIGMIWEGTDNQSLVGDQDIELSVFAGGLAKTGHVLNESRFRIGLKELYHGYDESNRKSNSVEKTKLVNWEKEDFIMTGYSCPKKGHIFTIAAQLQNPLNSGRLFLAGEYTHVFDTR